ncbi:hypothetical protein FSB78_12080 [Sphingomonas ginsenosidivorax]|jgi:antitoxin VapB|uniref:Transcription factor n=1 Tax=Sphingomonas ginsenosidivorax TaxID=862135 RepID=A0A5C6UHR7_9SPHN|nr:hypothetical protein [Sphingomonas ginsenosidivorax]TXC71605.1 hypothetical protein FSB78_12080 [Sphingomonas ginsenosidivorax]
MNAPSRPTTRAQAQALSAPFLVEDEEVVRKIARIADERGTPMAEIVALAIEDYELRLDLGKKAPERMVKFWAEHPLPLPTGLKADKAFYDELSGDV